MLGGCYFYIDVVGVDDCKLVGDCIVVGGLVIGLWLGFGDVRKVGECWLVFGVDDNGMLGG